MLKLRIVAFIFSLWVGISAAGKQVRVHSTLNSKNGGKTLLEDGNFAKGFLG